MDEYKIILKIAAYLLEYPDENWRKEFPEYRDAAKNLKAAQTRDVLLDLFDYVEQFGAKEYEREYVRKFDFSQNTNLYLTTHNRTDFGKQSNEMLDYKKLFLENGYDLQKELPDYLPALLELAINVEPAQAKKILETARPKIELLRERFIEAKLPQVFLLDVILSQLSTLEVTNK
ncbi:MAG: nitrate reductase molybdenum cofactor assembly chaperone [Selenomonadaceae bacterium]|nr:nitrate reductase molybdenum cofactor assembly chaperone [Selenomonadaceae bacterium]MBR6888630.1 nitrate reductase molybdenum cofactor assembly chaperone [Selenomonadaceae bacterium]